MLTPLLITATIECTLYVYYRLSLAAHQDGHTQGFKRVIKASHILSHSPIL